MLMARRQLRKITANTGDLQGAVAGSHNAAAAAALGYPNPLMMWPPYGGMNPYQERNSTNLSTNSAK
jgi:hypothetical protein